MKGIVTRVIKSHGSAWGSIRPEGVSREAFFNLASLVRPADLSAMEQGQEVEFEEEADPVNGTRAVQVVCQYA